MVKNIKKIYPRYFEEFKCIGGKCEDSCCIGWNIDIDKITFKKYFKVKDPEMKRMFQKNVQNNERCSSEDIDYGIVKLKKDKRCPFLDEENYCVIHSNLGEDYLSNVCTCFPRVTNKIDDTYEMSLDVACPEAARLILLNKEGIKFVSKEESIGKHIISAQIDSKIKEVQNSPLRYFREIRDFCIDIIQNRDFKLNERLYILGDFINKLEDQFNNNLEDIDKFISTYNVKRVAKEYSSEDINSLLGNDNMNYIIQMNAESDYIESNEAKLLESFTRNKTSNTSSNTNIFDSLQGEPLMIVSTDEHEGILELTVLGSTERMINWINTVEEKDPSRRIEIEDIERKGNVVYVHCAIKSIIKP